MFIPAFMTNVMTSNFLSSVSPGWVVMFLNSHRTVFTFLSWLDLLVVVLVFSISILKIFKSLPNYWHRVTDITSFEKHLKNSSGHILSFYPNLVKYRSKQNRESTKGYSRWKVKNMFRKESHPFLYGDLVYKLRRVQCEANFVSSGSKTIKRLRRQKYDPVIIERTKGLVLGPSTALYISFLKHCTLTNKAVGAIWRHLSKPPQRRQDLDPRPLLLFSWDSFGPRTWSRSQKAEQSPTLADVFIYYIYIFYQLTCLCYNLYGISALVGCWLLVYIRRIIHKFLMCVRLISELLLFHITNFPFLSSNVPSWPVYVVFISQLIWYAKASSSYECFILRAVRLSNKRLGQGYVKERLRSSLRKFYGRYGDLIKQYVPISQMLHDILDDDQWHPPLIRHYTNYWPYYWSWPYYWNWRFT